MTLGRCPPSSAFLSSQKRKKGNKRKKEKNSKRILFKGCHQSQNVTVWAILERPEFKNFSCQPTILFTVPWLLHFEIHFVGPDKTIRKYQRIPLSINCFDWVSVIWRNEVLQKVSSRNSWELLMIIIRSSHWRCSIKKVFLKISQRSQESRSVTWLKIESGTGVFLWILWNFKEHLFHRRILDDCFWVIKRTSIQSFYTHSKQNHDIHSIYFFLIFIYSWQPFKQKTIILSWGFMVAEMLQKYIFIFNTFFNLKNYTYI